MDNSNSTGWMEGIYRFARSVKLTVVLLLYLTITSGLTTFVPQGRELALYTQDYSPFLSWLILNTGFDNFFKAPLFLFPIGLFILNLTVCTLHRFIIRFKKKLKKRYGPDILHLGLLVLALGSVITASGRQQSYVTLKEGQQVKLPGDYILTLKSFQFLTYENGAPKDWISTVDVSREGKELVHEFPIEVNKPLTLGNYKLYQTNYDSDQRLILEDSDKNRYQVQPNQIIPLPEGALVFRAIIQRTADPSSWIALFDQWKDHQISGTIQLGISDQAGEFRIVDLFSDYSTGLQIVKDPGYGFALIGFILITVGLALTYIQKIGDNLI